MAVYHGRRISSVGLRMFSRSCSGRIVGNPYLIALRQRLPVNRAERVTHDRSREQSSFRLSLPSGYLRLCPSDPLFKRQRGSERLMFSFLILEV